MTRAIPDYLNDQFLDELQDRLTIRVTCGPAQVDELNVDLLRKLVPDLKIGGLGRVREIASATLSHSRAHQRAFDLRMSEIIEVLSHHDPIAIVRWFETNGRSFEGTPFAGLTADAQRVVDGMDPQASTDIAAALVFFGDGDFDEAYARAVKAVEHAAIPVVEPNNNAATLGSVINVVRNRGIGFVVARSSSPNGSNEVDSRDVLLGMLQALWVGHSSRHGGPNSIPNGSDETSVAIGLAAALVRIFSDGLTDRIDS